MNHKIASILGISAMAAVGLVGRDANAAWARQHASACFGALWNGQYQPVWSDVDYTVKNTISPTQAEELECAVPDTDTAEKSSWTVVNVETWEGSGSTAARLCEEDWADAGGSCSSGLTTPGPGHQTLALGPYISSVWNSGTVANFGYVYVDVGTGSELRGIFYIQ